MSRRYWLPAIALGLVLAGAYAKPIDAAQPASADPKQRKSQIVQTQPPHESPLIQGDIDRIAKALETANAREDSSEEKKRAQDDLDAQRKMADAAQATVMVAWFEAVITLVGVLLVGWTLYHTKRAADAARDAVEETKRIGEAQTRAYLFVKRAWLRQYSFNSEISLEIVNTGQTPVKWLEVEGNSQILQDTSVKSHEVPINPLGEFKLRWPTDPGSKGRKYLCDTDGGGQTLKKKVDEARERKSLVIQGTVRWQTLFDEVYESTFFYWSIPRIPVTDDKGGIKPQKLTAPSNVEIVTYRRVAHPK